MIVDLEEKTEEGWFDLRDGGRVHLRLMSSTDVKEMRKACFTTVAEYPLLEDEAGKASYKRFEARRFDEDLWEEMRWDRCVLGWENVFDRNMTPVPVTKENKYLLMSKVPEFIKSVEDGMKALKDAEQARIEEEIKNLSGGSSLQTSKPDQE